MGAASYGEKCFDVKILPISFEVYAADTKFDIITMFNVLEHATDPIYTVRKAKDYLSEHGLLVLELPYIYNPLSVFSAGYWHHFDVQHNWFFGMRHIRQFLEAEGFRIRELTFIPKIITLARLFDGVMSSSGIYYRVSRKTYLELRQSRIYRYINDIPISINIHDYILAVFQNS